MLPRRDLHGQTPGLLGLARRRRRPRRVGAARADELRQGPAGPVRARLARDVARPLPQRAGRRSSVSALELAERALRAVDGRRGARRSCNSERSGLARFAALRGAPADADRERGRRAAGRPRRPARRRGRRTAPTTRALRALAARARARRRDSAPPDPRLPGFAPAAEPPAVEGYDEATAALGPRSRRGSPRRRSTRGARPLRLLHERRRPSSRSPRRPGSRPSRR